MIFLMRGIAILAICFVAGAGVVGLVGATFASGSNSVQEPWQVVKDNVTVTGRMAFIVTCGVFAMGCLPDCCTSIDNIQLINYRGDYYYVRNVQQPTCHIHTETTITATDYAGADVAAIRAGLAGHVATTIIAGCQAQSILPITMWFTNSTVYCISPAVGPEGNNWGIIVPTCPS